MKQQRAMVSCRRSRLLAGVVGVGGFLWVMLCCPAGLLAQGIRLGVHVDPQLVWFSSDIGRFSNDGAHIGVNTGLDIEYFFAERYAFASGVSFDLRRANLRYGQDGYVVRTAYDGKIPVPGGTLTETKAYQMQIPLCVKLRAIEIGYTTIFATAGLTTNITFNENVSSTRLHMSEVRTDEMYYTANLGYLLMAGIEYSLGGPSAVQLGVGYNGGITPAYDPGKGQIRIHAVQLRLGFVF